jgi:serine kinase of HPr protein (carbohydrate metabolism regulator)
VTSRLAHATAIVIGTTGVVLVGASGAGKSSMALRLISAARQAGHFATLVSDDQIFLERISGRVIARAPASITGLIELRGSGIGRIDPMTEAVMHMAVSVVDSDTTTRIPEENQLWCPHDDVVLPLYFVGKQVQEPFLWLSVLISGFPVRE